MEPIILSTDSSAYFANEMSERLPTPEFLPVIRKTFGNGEGYLRIELDQWIELLGRDIILVGSTASDADFEDICRLGSGAADSGAYRVTYVIPFFGYSTMERAVKPGEIVMAKVRARQLSQLPQGDVRNRFFMMDLHASGLVRYFEGNCFRFKLYAEAVLTAAVEELGLSNFMFASADLGRPLWVETFAKKFRTPVAFIRKSREFEETHVDDVIGDVAGKTVVIYDDMVRSSDTLVDAAEAYLQRGASSIYAVVSHLSFNSDAAIDLLLASPIKKIIGTNSHQMSQRPKVANSSRFVVKDVSHLFADVAMNLGGHHETRQNRHR
jgi:ribose-phosphate pyrophosphokinase